MAHMHRPTPADAGMMGGLQSEVSMEAAPLLQFITRHVRIIVGVILLLVLAIIVSGVYQWHSARTLREAQMRLGRVLTGTQGEAKVLALEALLAEVPASMREGVRLEAAMAALELEQYDQAATLFGEVAAADDGPMGIAAAMNQSDTLLRSGKPEEALRILEALQGKAPESMKIILLETIGAVAEEAGMDEQAIQAYEAILAAGNAPDTQYYAYRIEQLRGSAAAIPTGPLSGATLPAGETTVEPEAATGAAQPAE